MRTTKAQLASTLVSYQRTICTLKEMLACETCSDGPLKRPVKPPTARSDCRRLDEQLRLACIWPASWEAAANLVKLVEQVGKPLILIIELKPTNSSGG